MSFICFLINIKLYLYYVKIKKKNGDIDNVYNMSLDSDDLENIDDEYFFYDNDEYYR